VNGDRLYNGAFDDAAYVATLIDFAETVRASGRRFKRSILFCVFTAEERGLLGSQYFVSHPTVPKPQIVADINLDTLRPIFPLRSLTTLGRTVPARRGRAPGGRRDGDRDQARRRA